MKKVENPEVSVVIVNYNTMGVLRDCLLSIEKQTKETSTEVIVVDNASTDGSKEMLAKEFPWVKVVASPVNLGFGKANNLGVKQAKGEFVYFLNSDTLLLNDTVSLLRDFMQREPRAGVCGGCMYDREMRPNLTVVRQHKVRDFYLMVLTPLVSARRLDKVDTRWHGKQESAEVDCIIGANMMMRRDVFEEVGGFDPDFFMYWEEVELINRVKRQGLRVFIVPEARLIHLEGRNVQGAPVKERLYGERLYSQWLYLWKAYGTKAAQGVYAANMIKLTGAQLFYTVVWSRERRDYWQRRARALRESYKRFKALRKERR